MSVEEFMVKCKSHRFALKQAKGSYNQIHKQLAKQQEELSRVLQSRVEYDAEVALQREVAALITKQRGELYSLKKEVMIAGSEADQAEVVYAKYKEERKDLEKEAQRWARQLQKVNNDRVKQHDLWQRGVKGVAQENEKLASMRADLNSIKTIVSATLQRQEHITLSNRVREDEGVDAKYGQGYNSHENDDDDAYRVEGMPAHTIPSSSSSSRPRPPPKQQHIRRQPSAFSAVPREYTAPHHAPFEYEYVADADDDIPMSM
jgi:cytochrome c556